MTPAQGNEWIFPFPSVVRDSSGSWNMTSRLSRVIWMSVSIPSAPSAHALANDARVFSAAMTREEMEG
jgi:hypothetical protein